MGPMCDRNAVSRAKLAYIVDSTAAPIASLAIVSTWVGYEVGLLDSAIGGTEALAEGLTGFQLFLTAPAVPVLLPAHAGVRGRHRALGS